MRPVPGKGLGLVATRNIKQGEVILSEDPLLFINNDDNEILKSLNSQFENLSAENKKKVIGLCDPDPEGEEDQKIIRIFTVNRIQGKGRCQKHQRGYGGGVCIFPPLSS